MRIIPAEWIETDFPTSWKKDEKKVQAAMKRKGKAPKITDDAENHGVIVESEIRDDENGILVKMASFKPENSDHPTDLAIEIEFIVKGVRNAVQERCMAFIRSEIEIGTQMDRGEKAFMRRDPARIALVMCNIGEVPKIEVKIGTTPDPEKYEITTEITEESAATIGAIIGNIIPPASTLMAKGKIGIGETVMTAAKSRLVSLLEKIAELTKRKK